MKIATLFLTTFFAFANFCYAQETTNQIPERIFALVKNLKYQQGEIDLGGGLAKLTVPKEFNFLGSEDAETVLVKLWGNPPAEKKPLGLLLPTGMTPISSNVWVVTIHYSEDGFVKEDEASKINYDDLLKQMQKGIAENNPARKEKGYPEITLVGWAASPHYDSATHKLYWAKHLKFEGTEEDTLNYSIRMLGRKGVLELNAIAGIEQFDAIDKQAPQILNMIDFKEGSRYADFDPKVDKVAVYGIAAMVAGGIAAKFGMFKLLIPALIAAKKFIVVGVIAIVAFIKKMFKRGDSAS